MQAGGRGRLFPRANSNVISFVPQSSGVRPVGQWPRPGPAASVQASATTVTSRDDLKRPANTLQGIVPPEKKMLVTDTATAAADTAAVADGNDNKPVSQPGATAPGEENPAIQLIQRYRGSLGYEFVGQAGPAHQPVFTCKLEVDGQTFYGAGPSKASAKQNVAQVAVQALKDSIEAELASRAANKEMQADGENDPEHRPPLRGKSSLKVLKEIRPGIVVKEKQVKGLQPGEYAASTVLNGREFVGRGASLLLAKANCAELAVSKVFNIQFERTGPGGMPLFTGDSNEYIQHRLDNALTLWNDDKNPIMQLNELYYEGAVYEYTDDGIELPDGSVVCRFGSMRHGARVTVDGIVATGRGETKKDAKAAAAASAVQKLKACGLFTKRVTEKELNKVQRCAAEASGSIATVQPYRMMVTGGTASGCMAPAGQDTESVADNAVAKLNRLHKDARYELTEQNMGDPQHSTFVYVINLNGHTYSGKGRSKKTAKLEAAENALRSLGEWTSKDDQVKARNRLIALQKAKNGDSPSPNVVSMKKLTPGVPQAFQKMRGHALRGAAAGGLVRGRGRAVGQASGPMQLMALNVARGRGRGRGVALGRGQGAATVGNVPTSLLALSHRGSGAGLGQVGRGIGRASVIPRGAAMASRGSRGVGKMVGFGRGSVAAAIAQQASSSSLYGVRPVARSMSASAIGRGRMQEMMAVGFGIDSSADYSADFTADDTSAYYSNFEDDSVSYDIPITTSMTGAGYTKPTPLSQRPGGGVQPLIKSSRGRGVQPLLARGNLQARGQQRFGFNVPSVLQGSGEGEYAADEYEQEYYEGGGEEYDYQQEEYSEYQQEYYGNEAFEDQVDYSGGWGNW